MALRVTVVMTLPPDSISGTFWVASATLTGSFDGVTVTSMDLLVLTPALSRTVTSSLPLAPVLPSSTSAEVKVMLLSQACALLAVPVMVSEALLVWLSLSLPMALLLRLTVTMTVSLASVVLTCQPLSVAVSAPAALRLLGSATVMPFSGAVTSGPASRPS